MQQTRELVTFVLELLDELRKHRGGKLGLLGGMRLFFSLRKAAKSAFADLKEVPAELAEIQAEDVQELMEDFTPGVSVLLSTSDYSLRVAGAVMSIVREIVSLVNLIRNKENFDNPPKAIVLNES